jgi:hypothetical protein
MFTCVPIKRDISSQKVAKQEHDGGRQSGHISWVLKVSGLRRSIAFAFPRIFCWFWIVELIDPAPSDDP